MSTPTRTEPIPRTGTRAGEIRDQLHDAIVDRRLTPGTKLVEDEIGATFSASRTVVRAALQALAFDGIVTLEPNRGASVSKPSPEVARQVFDARRMIEPGLALAAAARITAADVAMLEQHLATEAEAIAARGPSARRAEIHASGELHLSIAAIAGNEILSRFLRELVARSSLVIALYGRSGASSCARDEHGRIVAALASGNGRAAAELMRHHIDHIEADLDYQPAGEASIRDLLKL
ncbi:GntR family transcriptional regulator [Chthonobacter albigriseus]|uniref:GntR family transcriptional regulator n=1 Tax=Chthonobacter albigriseus TaxID=1683161 RepID=UPI0015EEAC41|nr:GntR family transcriptional regulator [Chthonobacter albigriseus]